MGVNATSRKLIEVESDWRSDKLGHGWLSTGRGPQFDRHATYRESRKLRDRN
jgi:hypothetical protein